jgi:hypothetical protein
MATTTSIHELSQKIDQVVREHIAASRSAGTAALGRAFGTAMRSTSAPRTRPPRAKPSRRRPPTEVAELGERFYDAVCGNPGETMAVLAAKLGLSARELNRPMSLLKRAGRLRTVGQRHLTRYFPAGHGAKASA